MLFFTNQFQKYVFFSPPKQYFPQLKLLSQASSVFPHRVIYARVFQWTCDIIGATGQRFLRFTLRRVDGLRASEK